MLESSLLVVQSVLSFVASLQSYLLPSTSVAYRTRRLESEARVYIRVEEWDASGIRSARDDNDSDSDIARASLRTACGTASGIVILS